MSSNLPFAFSVDKENNAIHIERAFNAPLELVWRTWTTAELLDQWFGPKPFKAETISMDFSEGGCWLYTLVSAEYGKQWGRTDYHKIVDLDYFTASDSFCDENLELLPDYPVSSWKIVFAERAGVTTIHVTTRYKTLEDLQKMVEWGYIDGFTSVMKNLDELLTTLKTK